MYNKLVNGELGLCATFWKFVVFGTVVLNFIVKFIGSLLARKLAGIPLLQYYSKYFNPLKMDSGLLILTVFYFVCVAFFLFYCITVIRSIWKSSETYERSIWLVRIAKLMTVIIVSVAVSSLF